MSPRKPTKKDLEKHIEEMDKQLEISEDKAGKYLKELQYAKADLQNMQKQNLKRIQDVMDRANGSILQQMIPLLDELQILGAFNAEENLIEGVQMVERKLMKVLEMEGVQPIEAVGLKFDPFRHEAIMEVETLNFEDGHVAEEIRQGYTYKDKVLRASVVKVAKAPDVVEIKIEDDQDE
ncbi:nucleotide exchange factor GrpE [Candidatus Bathyarchaeota archaeon]|nr:nucleotide exchange factor GrpE [Candidatus Bathyarchaeota archaeon]MBT4319245.1 nucleotide exchange factor GrpE [Candidatus Bathyarchaeota archaeon]MBT4423044.1 nucleotide exchange factor GrpE [Candidatus Bathyarchaeota archaeon]MBT5642101.1 nucleotide exchange factor GrpE [Candidatus Bathyarchaeota archaeon]MBT6603703.1 nucleotide exchange factor GrpE [Candidatus Bathyarchaeota archaeon]